MTRHKLKTKYLNIQCLIIDSIFSSLKIILAIYINTLIIKQNVSLLSHNFFVIYAEKHIILDGILMICLFGEISMNI